MGLSPMNRVWWPAGTGIRAGSMAIGEKLQTGFKLLLTGLTVAAGVKKCC